MKNGTYIYHTVVTVLKSNRKMIETEETLIHQTHIYMTPNTRMHDP
jgi:hypothetical protein